MSLPVGCPVGRGGRLGGVALPVGCPVGRRGSGTSNHRLRLTLAPAGRSSSFGAITEKGKVELNNAKRVENSLNNNYCSWLTVTLQASRDGKQTKNVHAVKRTVNTAYRNIGSLTGSSELVRGK